MKIVIRLPRVAPLAALLLLAACADLPDLSGYTAATSEVRQSVASAGDAVKTEIDNAAAGFEGDQRAAVKGYAETFDGAWKKTVAGMDAMVRYAQSLEGIAAAGNKGRESAQAVAGQIRDLAGSLDVPLAPAVGPAVDTGAWIYGEIARIEAMRSLEDAVAASGPVIARLQAVVAAQVADARLAFDSATNTQRLRLQEPDVFGATRRADDRLRQQIAPLTTQLAGLPPGDPRAAPLTAQMDALARSSEALAPQLAAYRSQAAALEARRKAGLALLDGAEGAIAAWGQAHSALVVALRNHRPVTLTSLNAAVGDLRDLIKRWRDL